MNRTILTLSIACMLPLGAHAGKSSAKASDSTSKSDADTSGDDDSTWSDMEEVAYVPDDSLVIYGVPAEWDDDTLTLLDDCITVVDFTHEMGWDWFPSPSECVELVSDAVDGANTKGAVHADPEDYLWEELGSYLPSHGYSATYECRRSNGSVVSGSRSGFRDSGAVSALRNLKRAINTCLNGGSATAGNVFVVTSASF